MGDQKKTNQLSQWTSACASVRRDGRARRLSRARKVDATRFVASIADGCGAARGEAVVRLRALETVVCVLVNCFWLQLELTSCS